MQMTSIQDARIKVEFNPNATVDINPKGEGVVQETIHYPHTLSNYHFDIDHGLKAV